MFLTLTNLTSSAMRTIRNHPKLFIHILCVLFLIQSCTVYKSENVNLSDVANTDLRVRITNKNGWKDKFSRVVLEDDGQFYGKIFVKSDKASNKFLIDKDNIEKVELQDIVKSIILNISGPLVFMGVILVILGQTNFI